MKGFDRAACSLLSSLPMKRLRDSADLDLFECDLIIDLLLEIALHVDPVTHCLLRHTCQKLYTTLPRFELLIHRDSLPLALDDILLHSLAQAHPTIIREALHLIYKDNAVFARFLYYLGLERSEEEAFVLFPFLLALELPLRGQYFAGKVRQLGFIPASRLRIYAGLARCAVPLEHVGDLFEDDSDSRPMADFIRATLRSLVAVNEDDCIEDFLCDIGALKMEIHLESMTATRKGLHGMFNVSVQILVQVLAENPIKGRAFARNLPSSEWRTRVEEYLEYELEE